MDRLSDLGVDVRMNINTHNNTPNDNDESILLVGGTGKTGRRVAERLVSAGRSVRVVSRSTTPAFDWNLPEHWHQSLEGVTAAYVVYYPDISFEGAADSVARFAEVAASSGVQRIVLLSGRGEPGAELSELAMRAAYPNLTVLRCTWFAQNFNEHFLLPSVLEGVIALPADGGVGEPFVDVEDVADVAVAALTDDRHDGQLYTLTGPELLTFTDVASELTRATRRKISFVSMSAEEWAAGAAAQGVPPEEVAPLIDLFTTVLDGRNEFVTADVPAVLGRPARTFAAYAAAAAATGVWDVPVKESA
jgi:uncharacterized protein YbjT (DUF2867 family)